MKKWVQSQAKPTKGMPVLSFRFERHPIFFSKMELGLTREMVASISPRSPSSALLSPFVGGFGFPY